MSSRQLRRRMPPSEYLLGYVEDNESIDKIMQKFQALEEYQQDTGRDDLTPEDCRELIVSTSLGDIQSSFRQKYVVSDVSSSSSEEEMKPAPYIDPITQSYRTIGGKGQDGQIIHGDILNLQITGSYQAILLNPPEKFPLRFKKRLKYLKDLMEKGLIFVWTHKAQIKEWVDVMENMKFQYVENMVWVMVDNKKVMQAGGLANLTDFTVDLLQTYPYSPFSQSHKTLLIFRKISAGKLELRHQRTCDVVFDYDIPKNYVYHLIETLLPESGVKLELWADGDPRDDWLHVVNSEQ